MSAQRRSFSLGLTRRGICNPNLLEIYKISSQMNDVYVYVKTYFNVSLLQL